MQFTHTCEIQKHYLLLTHHNDGSKQGSLCSNKQVIKVDNKCVNMMLISKSSHSCSQFVDMFGNVDETRHCVLIQRYMNMWAMGATFLVNPFLFFLSFLLVESIIFLSKENEVIFSILTSNVISLNSDFL